MAPVITALGSDSGYPQTVRSLEHSLTILFRLLPVFFVCILWSNIFRAFLQICFKAV